MLSAAEQVTRAQAGRCLLRETRLRRPCMLQCGDLNTPRQPHCPCRGSSEKVFIRNIPAEKSTACSRSTSTSTAVLRCAATAGSGCLSSQLKCEDTHTGTPAGCSEQWSPKKCLGMMSEDLRAHPYAMFPSLCVVASCGSGLHPVARSSSVTTPSFSWYCFLRLTPPFSLHGVHRSSRTPAPRPPV